ncbi:hypothetical protein E5A73_20875 [Sphingomonas gei]|uniref:Glycosyltransferase n=1 Tax=Sphingomonas gei TaxID=1395960 RepID=A0A4S1X149_9SPHN|nr:glycosyltransferase family 4 protein [Sphingomonas gei]TGX48667.1 hypothetical protein E5A73_20875 [Sphingomonas gei]
MKIVLIESTIGAGAVKGHPEHFANGFAGAAAAAGADLAIVTHHNGDSTLGGGRICIPVLTYSAHDHISRDKYDAKLQAYRIGRERFAADLHGIHDALTNTDLFILPTASSRELSGLALWLTEVGQRSRIAAIFHWGGTRGYESGSLEAALLRQAAREVDKAKPLATWFGATQNSLAQALEGPLGRAVQVTPSLTFFCEGASGSPRSSRIRIGIMGGVRREKGAGLLDKIAVLLGRDERIELIIQCHGVDRSSWLLARLAGQPNVTLLHEWLDEDAMLSMCASLDLAILPYDRWVYGQAISGVFTLLAGVGVPSVVPSSTWMSDRIAADETAGVVYHRSSAEEVADSVRYAITQLDNLSLACKIKSEAWRMRYSADSITKELLELSGTDID